jgi:hypothetical protein
MAFFHHPDSPACCGSGLPAGLLNRRQMLGKMCAGFGLLGLASLLGQQASGAIASSTGTLRLPHFAPKAKRVVFLFLNGGPSHVDTFDPKPELAKREGEQPIGELYKKTKGNGFMPSPFGFQKHGQSGIDVCDTLPSLAGVIDDCCVIRSMHTDVPNHEPALLMMHTGNLQPIRPSMGSWLLYGLGTSNQNLPGYMVLRPSNKIVVGPALWSNSFLPAEYQATSVFTSDMAVDRLVANIHNPRLSEGEQREQLDLLAQLNRHHLSQRDADPALEGEIRAMETAFHMQRAAMDTFDISREPATVRAAYGDTPFARSCLLARRLLEDGVRVVSVYYTSGDTQPWDTHPITTRATPNFAPTPIAPPAPSSATSSSAACSKTRSSSGAANLAARPMRKTRTRPKPAATTITPASPCSSPVAASRAASPTAPPTNSA